MVTAEIFSLHEVPLLADPLLTPLSSFDSLLSGAVSLVNSQGSLFRYSSSSFESAFSDPMREAIKPNNFLAKNSSSGSITSNSFTEPTTRLNSSSFSSFSPTRTSDPLTGTAVTGDDSVEREDSKDYIDFNFNDTTNFDSLTDNTENSPSENLKNNDLVTDLKLSNSLSNLNTSSWPNSSLKSQGKFGDYDDFEDATLTIKDANGAIAETFALTGDGYGEVFKDDKYEYVVFSETDKNTSVQISAINNIKFDDYIGYNLQIQTQGSITAGDITLYNTNVLNSPGLILQSGLGEEETSTPGSYSVTNLGSLHEGEEYSISYATDINNSGQIVGYSKGYGSYDRSFLYSDGQMTDLGTLPGSEYSIARAINNSGQIAGHSFVNRTAHVFRYSNGRMTDLGVASTKSRGSYSNAINDSGQIVGEDYVTSDEGWTRPFLYSNGQMINIDSQGKGFFGSYAYDINNSGQVVGYWEDEELYYRPFLYSNGQMIDIGDLPGSDNSIAYAINDSGQIAGHSVFYESESRWNRTWRAFLYSNGQMTDLGSLPGSTYSKPNDINNSGQIVGFDSNNGTRRAFLYSNGQITDLNTLIPSEEGWSLEEATAINDSGQIVGNGIIDGEYRAFLLNPNPFISTPSDGITVGNISTLGDSINLQGQKITLIGESITSNGGHISLDGATRLKSSTSELTFDSTVSLDGSGGGNITFKDTLNGYTPNTENLFLKAGQGNITFNSSVGNSATLSDLTVKSALTVTAKADITSDGDIILKVIDNINTANLSTNNSSKINISLGKIDETTYDSKGNVTTGKITAKELEVMSDGAFTATGLIETLDGDVNVIALKNIAIGQMTAQNGAINLTSGTGAITATGELRSEYSLMALAIQNITTNKIESAQDAVVLHTSQGAITVNDKILSYRDVSLAAAKNVVATDITSRDGAVALMSASGTVTASGAISSIEDVTLGAVGDVVASQISAQLGTVALVSIQGAVTVNGVINGGIDVAISARKNVTTNTINSQGDIVALKSEQGTVTTSNIVTYGGSIYLFSAGNVISQNLISNGGAIDVISSLGSVTTGYLRSDLLYRPGGTIYLQAASQIKVNDSVSIKGKLYSIYTGTNKKGSVYVNYESALKTSQKSKFEFEKANININNGTVATVSGGVLISQKSGESPADILWRVIENIFKAIPTINLGGDTPSHVNEINPITNEPYSSSEERALVKQLTQAQQERLRELINKKTDAEELLDKETFRKGKVDGEHGCFHVRLGKHLGGYQPHTVYTVWVTGDNSDYLLIEPNKANYNFYDGEVKEPGQALKLKLEPPRSLAEVKTDQSYLIKAARGQQLKPDEQRNKNRLERQLYFGDLVARECGRKFFFSFDKEDVANAARQLYATRYPMVKFHYIKPGYPPF